MKPNSLTTWQLLCAELNRRGYLARVIIDHMGVNVEINLGNRRVSWLFSTAELEQSYLDLVTETFPRLVVEVNHAPKKKFQPWLAGGKDVTHE